MSRLAPLLRGITHAASFAVAAALLLAAARPIATDDLWWHAALGRFYAAAHGPWLESDPLLYTAAGPPAASAWLFDLGVFATGQAGGFPALRGLHVALVAAVLAFVWWLLRRASGSAAAASLGAMTFAALAAYRLAQLRPHLLTMLATLLLYRLVIEDRGAPSRGRVLAAIGLLALWANLHAAFVLGPALVAASLAALLLALPFQPVASRERDRSRAKALAVVLVLGGVATLVSPDGASRYLAFLEVGRETPALALVGDEWSALDPLRLPMAGLPPTLLAWALYWILLPSVALATISAVRGWKRAASGPDARVDPALVAMAIAGMAGPLLAVRLLWLPVFALLLLARSARGRWAAAPARFSPGAFAAGATLLAAGFFTLGDWPLIAGPVRSLTAGFAIPYQPGRYRAQAIWLLQDAGLEGNVFNEYSMGGFLGFWLAPRLRGSANGTLNVTMDALEANRAIRERRGLRPGEDFLALLDRQGVDLFLGVGLPTRPHARQPGRQTTTLLEGAPGWILAFRNLDSAIYVRDDARNQANLAALEAWYGREGVPFDPDSGFDVARVIREAPEWAVTHGMIPRNFERLLAAANGLDPVYRPRARDYLASVQAALGLYDAAIQIDSGTLAQDPEAARPRRRLVWALLHAGRPAEARRAAEPLSDTPSEALLTRQILDVARRAPELPAPERAALIARLPLFGRREADGLGADFFPGLPRPWPDAAQRASGPAAAD